METCKKICFKKNNVYAEIYNKDEKLIISINNELGKYEEIFSLNDLIKINKWFSLFDSINELLIDINNLIDSNEYDIKKENNTFNLILKISKIESKYVLISIKEKILDKEELINSLFFSISEIKDKLDKNSFSNSQKENEEIIKKVNDLEKKIKEINSIIENKFSDYETRLNFMEHKYISLKITNEEKINSLEQKYENKIIELEKKINQNNENMKINDNNNKNEKEEKKIKKEENKKEEISSIIKSKEEWNLIYNNISKEKELKSELIYKSLIDGDEALDFHKKCDNIPNTIILIKTKSGKRFGGFSSEIWENSPYTWKSDNKAFLFNLDLMKIFKSHNNGNRAILSYSFLGPTFGYGYDLYVPDKFLTHSAKDFMQHNGSFFNNKEDYQLTQGEKNYQILEVEVFKIIC